MSQYLLQTVVSWSSCCGFMVRALRSMMIIIISAVLSIYHSIGHHSATIHIQVTQPGDRLHKCRQHCWIVPKLRWILVDGDDDSQEIV